MYLLVFSRINRALGLKRTAPKVCVFSLFWGMVMYDNDFETKENKTKTKYKIEPKHIRGCVPTLVLWS